MLDLVVEPFVSVKRRQSANAIVAARSDELENSVMLKSYLFILVGDKKDTISLVRDLPSSM